VLARSKYLGSTGVVGELGVKRSPPPCARNGGIAPRLVWMHVLAAKEEPDVDVGT
jgi:hypothetical protein